MAKKSEKARLKELLDNALNIIQNMSEKEKILQGDKADKWYEELEKKMGCSVEELKQYGVTFLIDTYGCDGMNDNCMGAVRFDDINWFNSGLGFCDCCHERLFSQIGDRYDELYDRCEADDKKAVDEVIEMTR